ncbi:MAG: hypothetical protein ABI597_11940 [Gammaproteobacteria bacterium]
MSHARLAILGVGLLSSLLSLSIQAQETTTTIVEKRAIITPAPVSTCTTVEGHWEGTVWINTHQVCKYENRAEGVAWINDYWSCTTYTSDGNCTSWALVPGHWVKTLE